jgi:hypothetical protein
MPGGRRRQRLAELGPPRLGDLAQELEGQVVAASIGPADVDPGRGLPEIALRGSDRSADVLGEIDGDEAAQNVSPTGSTTEARSSETPSGCSR